jgi:S-adenosylmethionine hydrolase
MRGVVHRRTTGQVQVSDVAHDLPRQDTRQAAFWLRFVLPEYPPAVHCVVVDPGVGTTRDALVIRAGDHALVGPDNGVLLPPARALAAADGETHPGRAPRSAGGATDERDASRIEVFTVEVENPASATFHGRDVFAPTAADVFETGVDGLDALDALQPTSDYEDLVLPRATVGETDGESQKDTDETGSKGDTAEGEVLVVDDFGNAVTNVPGSFLAGRLGETVRVVGPERERTAPATETFASVPAGEPLVTVGSHGYVECDVNRGRGAEAFGLDAGDAVSLTVLD